MAFDGILITEIFYSLQGETSHTGLPYVFIRLTGCNLRCGYCDTTYAFKGGARRSVDEIIKEVAKWNCPRVLITGGEPLIQRNTPTLVKALVDQGYKVSIETHGEVDISEVSSLARIVMDVKTPGSQMCREGFWKNIPFLKPRDEIKFVITSLSDYEWSKNTLRDPRFPKKLEVLFSPVVLKENPFTPAELAEKILTDRLPVRFQLQLHKQLWGAERGK